MQKTKKTFRHEELDRRLAPAVEEPDRFEELADRLIRELDRRDADLEIADPSSWRIGGEREGAPRANPMQQFRADVERIETLDREAEARLARRVEFARRRLEKARAEAGLEPETPRDLLLEPEVPLPRRVARRAMELHALRTEMVERNLYLVLINVERYAQTEAHRMDLVQEGCLSLFRAVDGFDWRRGLLFRTYAVHWLNQAFRNYLYNSTSTVRVPVYLQKAMKHVNQAAARLGDPNASPAQIAEQTELNENLVSAAMSASRSSFSIDAGFSEDEDGSRLRDLLVVDQDEEFPYSARLEDVSLEQGLARALERLSERERLVVTLRFGIGEDRPHTLAEVAERLGVSVERVRQIQVRAIAKMNTPNLRRELDPFLN